MTRTPLPPIAIIVFAFIFSDAAAAGQTQCPADGLISGRETGELFVADPYEGASTGFVADSLYDPIPGSPVHVYSKRTGDVVWAYKYYNLLNPKIEKTFNGWARFSLSGLPENAVIESAAVSLYGYAFIEGGVGADMVLTALSIDPMSAPAQSLWNATQSGTVLSNPGGSLLWWELPMNSAGVSHVQNGISQGWVALGCRYSGTTGTVNKGYRCFGYNNAEYKPYITITYTMPASVDEMANPDPAHVRLNTFPNPFGSSTSINLVVPGDGKSYGVAGVWDVLGRRIGTLFAGELTGGTNLSLVWDGSDDVGIPLPGGVYLIRVQVEDNLFTAKAILRR